MNNYNHLYDFLENLEASFITSSEVVLTICEACQLDTLLKL
jgi:hypothetical protein